jgi:hypothetical protein
MWNAPYRGAAKQMYLQSKVFELLALHLDLICVHYTQEILTTQFENPPSLLELARQVG